MVKTENNGGEAAFCEGFHFRYFVADKSGRKREKKTPDAYFVKAENRFLDIVVNVLLNRQDLLEGIMCMDNGLEVHLYKGTGFQDFRNEVYFFGRVTQEDDQMVMELATEEILAARRTTAEAPHGHEALNVVIHELVHVLDFMDDEDGVMPGWDKREIDRFTQARTGELKKLRANCSPLDAYALTSRTEFIAVLAETYFLKPDELKASSKTLYNLMKSFFRIDPEELTAF